jgi:pyruvate/2-oxoglutarate dehydrogenase complex dihydrolipoamide acyltransferase (E2) component
VVKQDQSIGSYKVKKPSFFRRLLMDSLDALPPGHNMTALLELDVTEARKAIRRKRREGREISFFAFVVKSIAAAMAENKELNAIRSGKLIVEFEDIDISIPIELKDVGELTSRQIVIRKASEMTVEQIHMEIEEARTKHRLEGETGEEDARTLRMMRVLLLLPKFLRTVVLRRVSRNPISVKKMSGTTFVTSVSLFGLSGFAIPYLSGPKAVSFAVGGVVSKPAKIGGKVTAREFLSLTIMFNHDIVDGAPAARFSNRLRKLIEKGEVL